jgi:hypothetical protein
MFVLRATNSLLQRLKVAPAAGSVSSTTALGDWYGNLVRIGPTQFVLCTSERSLLSVVLPAREVRDRLMENLRQAVRQLLADLSVSAELAGAELDCMSSHTVAKTASRKVLGHMSDFAVYLDAACRMEPEVSLRRVAIELSGTPCGPSDHFLPRERAMDLLQRWQRRQTSG